LNEDKKSQLPIDQSMFEERKR